MVNSSVFSTLNRIGMLARRKLLQGSARDRWPQFACGLADWLQYSAATVADSLDRTNTAGGWQCAAAFCRSNRDNPLRSWRWCEIGTVRVDGGQAAAWRSTDCPGGSSRRGGLDVVGERDNSASIRLLRARWLGLGSRVPRLRTPYRRLDALGGRLGLSLLHLFLNKVSRRSQIVVKLKILIYVTDLSNAFENWHFRLGFLNSALRRSPKCRKLVAIAWLVIPGSRLVLVRANGRSPAPWE